MAEPPKLVYSSSRGYLDEVKALLPSKQLNAADDRGATALIAAAGAGHEAVVAELLAQKGIQVDAKDKMGQTALHVATWRGHEEIVKLLLKKGAKTDIKNKDGYTASDLAKKPSIAALFPDELDL